ncbi:unnamed protein product [Callosobruchus maculatus]|uniref:Tetraspanin n=1 Tax=Callosobruchus maculatus TaxID=64391 RepID=A0A653CGB1_CALMS|nr:unnamed protein product [Callosobruchus maculatus]
MESCGMSFIKYLLFIFNLFFALSGLGIIIAGALVLADVSDFSHFVTSDLVGPPIVLIVLGTIIFLVASLGCYGAIRENYKMLIAFAVLLIIIFIVEFAVGITAAVYKADFQDTLKSSLKKSLEQYSSSGSNSNIEKAAWDNVQQKVKCCGVDGKDDWQTTPISCCYKDKIEESDQPVQFCVSSGRNYMYKDGCYQKLQMKIESNTKILIGVGIGIAFIQVVGMFLAFWLAYTIKKEEEAK